MSWKAGRKKCVERYGKRDEEAENPVIREAQLKKKKGVRNGACKYGDESRYEVIVTIDERSKYARSDCDDSVDEERVHDEGGMTGKHEAMSISCLFRRLAARGRAVQIFRDPRVLQELGRGRAGFVVDLERAFEEVRRELGDVGRDRGRCH